MNLVTKQQTSKINLNQLADMRAETQRKLDERLRTIREGKVEDISKMMEEIKVLRENLSIIKETQSISNRKIWQQIYELKDSIDIRNALYKGKEKQTLKLFKAMIKNLNSVISRNREIMDNHNKSCVVDITLYYF